MFPKMSVFLPGTDKHSCRAFPEQNGHGIASGPKRNFQILSPLDFLAEFTQHIPPKGSHAIRYWLLFKQGEGFA